LDQATHSEGNEHRARSAQKIFANAKAKSGINPNAAVHALRHSFATCLLESGVELRYFQELLGHEGCKAIGRCAHLQGQGEGPMADG
jgi:site-specific recombinase XerD